MCLLVKQNSSCTEIERRSSVRSCQSLKFPSLEREPNRGANPGRFKVSRRAQDGAQGLLLRLPNRHTREYRAARDTSGSWTMVLSPAQVTFFQTCTAKATTVSVDKATVPPVLPNEIRAFYSGDARAYNAVHRRDCARDRQTAYAGTEILRRRPPSVKASF